MNAGVKIKLSGDVKAAADRFLHYFSQCAAILCNVQRPVVIDDENIQVLNDP